MDRTAKEPHQIKRGRVRRGPGKRGRVGHRLLCLAMALGIVATFGGCTRAFYRKQADKEVVDILQEKDKVADWKIEQWHVYPDPRARFANPNKPDRPPMPPDDEAAWKYSPHPQHPGHAGVATDAGTGYLDLVRAWDSENRAGRTAAPSIGAHDSEPSTRRSGPIQSLFDGPVMQQQGFLINLDNAVELGLVNAREYQSVREDLYLAALPVTLQRFSFVWQWTVVENAVRQWAGPASSVGHQNNWNIGSTAGASKMFSTGALLTMSFANNTVFNFLNGAQGLTSSSTFNLNLVQPLLQGGGRAVTLEPLTQAERNLFYEIRAYARFREQFYASIMLGTNLPSSLPSSAGISSGGSGGGSFVSVLASLGIASTDVAGQFRGYLPTLFRELDLAVDRKYVSDLEKALKLFAGLQEGGQIAPLQVDQVNSTLLQARNTVLKDMQDRSNAADSLKLQLGVPVNMPLVLDDLPARPITRQLDRYYEVLAEADAAYKLLEQQDALAPEKVRPFLLQVYTEDPLVRNTAFQKKVPISWGVWAAASDQDIKARLLSLSQQRRKLLDTKTDLEMKGQSLTPEQAITLREADFEADLGSLEQILRRYEARPWEKLAKEEARKQDRSKLFRLVTYAAQLVLVWARNERVSHVGTLWPVLPPAHAEDVDLLNADMDLAQERAAQIALTNRWDLMNARAQVVDTWRQLAVTANGLLGVLNVQYHLDTRTPPGGTSPLAFSSAATNQELIINGQLPLVRVNERNAYRTALINYERARRNLMSLEDNIAAQVRFDVRQLHLFAENYKIQQKVLDSLYSQVENALEVIVAPVDPDQLKASGTAGQANAAALTNQYLGVLGQLNGAQTKMYDIWLSYLATRMQLYLDLERLPLDLRGVWIDETGNAAPSPSSLPAAGAVQHLPNLAPGDSGADVGGADNGAGQYGAARPAGLGRPLAPDERGEPERQQPEGTADPDPRARLIAPAAHPGLE